MCLNTSAICVYVLTNIRHICICVITIFVYASIHIIFVNVST